MTYSQIDMIEAVLLDITMAHLFSTPELLDNPTIYAHHFLHQSLATATIFIVSTSVQTATLTYASGLQLFI
jgi:hypothetical protein